MESWLSSFLLPSGVSISSPKHYPQHGTEAGAGTSVGNPSRSSPAFTSSSKSSQRYRDGTDASVHSNFHKQKQQPNQRSEEVLIVFEGLKKALRDDCNNRDNRDGNCDKRGYSKNNKCNDTVTTVTTNTLTDKNSNKNSTGSSKDDVTGTNLMSLFTEVADAIEIWERSEVGLIDDDDDYDVYNTNSSTTTSCFVDDDNDTSTTNFDNDDVRDDRNNSNGRQRRSLSSSSLWQNNTNNNSILFHQRQYPSKQPKDHLKNQHSQLQPKHQQQHQRVKKKTYVVDDDYDDGVIATESDSDYSASLGNSSIGTGNSAGMSSIATSEEQQQQKQRASKMRLITTAKINRMMLKGLPTTEGSSFGNSDNNKVDKTGSTAKIPSSSPLPRTRHEYSIHQKIQKQHHEVPTSPSTPNNHQLPRHPQRFHKYNSKNSKVTKTIPVSPGATTSSMDTEPTKNISSKKHGRYGMNNYQHHRNASKYPLLINPTASSVSSSSFGSSYSPQHHHNPYQKQYQHEFSQRIDVTVEDEQVKTSYDCGGDGDGDGDGHRPQHEQRKITYKDGDADNRDDRDVRHSSSGSSTNMHSILSCETEENDAYDKDRDCPKDEDENRNSQPPQQKHPQEQEQKQEQEQSTQQQHPAVCTGQSHPPVTTTSHLLATTTTTTSMINHNNTHRNPTMMSTIEEEDGTVTTVHDDDDDDDADDDDDEATAAAGLTGMTTTTAKGTINSTASKQQQLQQKPQQSHFFDDTSSEMAEAEASIEITESKFLDELSSNSNSHSDHSHTGSANEQSASGCFPNRSNNDSETAVRSKPKINCKAPQQKKKDAVVSKVQLQYLQKFQRQLQARQQQQQMQLEHQRKQWEEQQKNLYHYDDDTEYEAMQTPSSSSKPVLTNTLTPPTTTPTTSSTKSIAHRRIEKLQQERQQLLVSPTSNCISTGFRQKLQHPYQEYSGPEQGRQNIHQRENHGEQQLLSIQHQQLQQNIDNVIIHVVDHYSDDDAPNNNDTPRHPTKSSSLSSLSQPVPTKNDHNCETHHEHHLPQLQHQQHSAFEFVNKNLRTEDITKSSIRMRPNLYDKFPRSDLIGTNSPHRGETVTTANYASGGVAAISKSEYAAKKLGNSLGQEPDLSLKSQQEQDTQIGGLNVWSRESRIPKYKIDNPQHARQRTSSGFSQSKSANFSSTSEQPHLKYQLDRKVEPDEDKKFGLSSKTNCTRYGYNRTKKRNMNYETNKQLDDNVQAQASRLDSVSSPSSDTISKSSVSATTVGLCTTTEILKSQKRLQLQQPHRTRWTPQQCTDANSQASTPKISNHKAQSRDMELIQQVVQPKPSVLSINSTPIRELKLNTKVNNNEAEQTQANALRGLERPSEDGHQQTNVSTLSHTLDQQASKSQQLNPAKSTIREPDHQTKRASTLELEQTSNRKDYNWHDAPGLNAHESYIQKEQSLQAPQSRPDVAFVSEDLSPFRLLQQELQQLQSIGTELIQRRINEVPARLMIAQNSPLSSRQLTTFFSDGPSTPLTCFENKWCHFKENDCISPQPQVHGSNMPTLENFKQEHTPSMASALNPQIQFHTPLQPNREQSSKAILQSQPLPSYRTPENHPDPITTSVSGSSQKTRGSNQKHRRQEQSRLIRKKNSIATISQRRRASQMMLNIERMWSRRNCNFGYPVDEKKYEQQGVTGTSNSLLKVESDNFHFDKSPQSQDEANKIRHGKKNGLPNLKTGKLAGCHIHKSIHSKISPGWIEMSQQRLQCEKAPLKFDDDNWQSSASFDNLKNNKQNQSENFASEALPPPETIEIIIPNGDERRSVVENTAGCGSKISSLLSNDNEALNTPPELTKSSSHPAPKSNSFSRSVFRKARSAIPKCANDDVVPSSENVNSTDQLGAVTQTAHTNVIVNRENCSGSSQDAVLQIEGKNQAIPRKNQQRQANLEEIIDCVQPLNPTVEKNVTGSLTGESDSSFSNPFLPRKKIRSHMGKPLSTPTMANSSKEQLVEKHTSESRDADYPAISNSFSSLSSLTESSVFKGSDIGRGSPIPKNASGLKATYGVSAGKNPNKPNNLTKHLMKKSNIAKRTFSVSQTIIEKSNSLCSNVANTCKDSVGGAVQTMSVQADLDEMLAPQTLHKSDTSFVKLEQEVRRSFQAWNDAWNRGDLSSFLDSYYDSEETRYVSESLVKSAKNGLVGGVDSISSYTSDNLVLNGKTAISDLFKNIFEQCKKYQTKLRQAKKQAKGTAGLLHQTDQMSIKILSETDALVFGHYRFEIGNHKTSTGVFTIHLQKVAIPRKPISPEEKIKQKALASKNHGKHEAILVKDREGEVTFKWRIFSEHTTATPTI